MRMSTFRCLKLKTLHAHYYTIGSGIMLRMPHCLMRLTKGTPICMKMVGSFVCDVHDVSIRLWIEKNPFYFFHEGVGSFFRFPSCFFRMWVKSAHRCWLIGRFRAKVLALCFDFLNGSINFLHQIVLLFLLHLIQI